MIPQFGTMPPTYTDRPGAYAIIFNDKNEILVVEVRERFHLPGGGIDPGELAKDTVQREVLEETGYTIIELSEIGSANQYFANTDRGPLNKLGTFFKARVDAENQTPSEEDHHERWVQIETVLNSTMADFQKWGIQQAMQ